MLALAIAALAACWNPFAAPFGLVVGVAAAIPAARSLRAAGERRRLAAAALTMSLVAVVASVVVMALTAGSVGIDLPGEPVVKARTQAELDQVLSDAGERTRARRERASRELDSLGAPGRPAGGAAARDGGAAKGR